MPQMLAWMTQQEESDGTDITVIITHTEGQGQPGQCDRGIQLESTSKYVIVKAKNITEKMNKTD